MTQDNLKKLRRRQIETLRRRADFLERRIADYKGKDPDRDRQELGALRWAISVCEIAARAGWGEDSAS